jgi:hypothetical protein
MNKNKWKKKLIQVKNHKVNQLIIQDFYNRLIVKRVKN